MDNWGTRGFGGFIDLVYSVLLLVYSGTLDLAGTPVFVVGVFEIDVLCCNTRSVI